MNYFFDCKTDEEVKKKYRELAKKFHPDHGGNANDMIELQKQYEAWRPSKSHQDFQEDLRKHFEEAQQTYNQGFGSYTGYKYNTNQNINNEYFKQRNDPRVAEYEAMKSQYNYMKFQYDGILAKQYQLTKENNDLKKKIESYKRKLDKLKKPKKDIKKDSKDASICL